ncbi:MAG: hypothetical protein M3243_05485, partial [Thermoproteota archaeon]|nr:hypothetical protein [Thermoproteota archaeon]
HNLELGKRRISATIEILFFSSKDRKVSHERFECPIVKIIGLSINMIHGKLQYSHYGSHFIYYHHY